MVSKNRDLVVFNGKNDIKLASRNQLLETKLGQDAVMSELSEVKDRPDIHQFLDTLEGPVTVMAPSVKDLNIGQFSTG